jgi:signal transduction histidine kinase
MIEGLLAYSRVSATELALHPVSLSAVIQEALQQLAARVKETNATLHIPDQLPTVRAQRTALAQVFANLFDNAFKFVAPGVAPSVQVTATRDRDRVRVRIQDNGIGISQADQARVFEVFERVDSRAYSGSGIGLAIVRKAIEKMGGSIQLESQPGRGSSFVINLPAAS